MITEAQQGAARAFPVPSAPPSLPPSQPLMSLLFMAAGWSAAGAAAVCGASQVRALGVLIPGWGCYLFELVFEKLTSVRVSARTNPFPAYCYSSDSTTTSDRTGLTT